MELSSGRLLEIDQDLPALTEAATQAAETLRGIIGDLRKSPLGREGFKPAVARLLKGYSDHFPGRIHLTLSDAALAPSIQLALYQVLREALANAVIHSGAQDIWIRVEDEPSGVHLEVRDNGLGFDPERAKPGHYGLQILRERVASAGGQVYLDTRLGQGTTLTVWVPVPRTAQSCGRGGDST